MFGRNDRSWKKYFIAFIINLVIFLPQTEATSLSNNTPFPISSKWSLSKKSVTKKIQKLRTMIVVIDAGHGGKDSGARGRHGILEKDVVLQVAKRLRIKLQQIAGIRVMLTRTDDRYMPLRTRLKIARLHRADLFLAIHADAYFNQYAKGASVYALSTHGATSEAARWLAQRDNYSELGSIELGELQDSSLMLRSVLIDLAQTVTIKDSIRLGKQLLAALGKVGTLHHKEVEQARFVVLKSPDIPSVLVEIGFISHREEEKWLSHSIYQDKIARALTAGVKQYIKSMKND